jgi:hypothetical protein
MTEIFFNGIPVCSIIKKALLTLLIIKLINTSLKIMRKHLNLCSFVPNLEKAPLGGRGSSKVC